MGRNRRRRYRGRGDVYLSDSSEVAGDIEADGAVITGDSSSIDGDIDAGEDVSVGGSTVVGGSIETDGGVSLADSSEVAGDIDAGEDVSLDGGNTVEGDVSAGGDLTVGWDSIIDGDVIAGGDVTVEGPLSMETYSRKVIRPSIRPQSREISIPTEILSSSGEQPSREVTPLVERSRIIADQLQSFRDWLSSQHRSAIPSMRTPFHC
ncbi:hypothetical protein D8S78_05455 [Natrialba swarupiae]|nr:hypothetical protein [Natrialba swarupiae]